MSGYRDLPELKVSDVTINAVVEAAKRLVNEIDGGCPHCVDAAFCILFFIIATESVAKLFGTPAEDEARTLADIYRQSAASAALDLMSRQQWHAQDVATPSVH